MEIREIRKNFVIARKQNKKCEHFTKGGKPCPLNARFSVFSKGTPNAFLKFVCSRHVEVYKGYMGAK